MQPPLPCTLLRKSLALAPLTYPLTHLLKPTHLLTHFLSYPLVQYAGCAEIDTYLQNPEQIQPTEFPTSKAHVPKVVSGKERSKELTGDVGPVLIWQQQNRSSSMSFIHAGQEV